MARDQQQQRKKKKEEEEQKRKYENKNMWRKKINMNDSLPKWNEVRGEIKLSTPTMQTFFNLASIKIFEKDTIQLVNSRIICFSFTKVERTATITKTKNFTFRIHVTFAD